MYIDYHVHSIFSDDSIYPTEKVVQDAINKHIEEICFTEHVDYGIKIDWEDNLPTKYRNQEPLLNCDYSYYVREIERLRKIYGDKIKIKLGLEFGIQPHTIDKYKVLFKRYPFDFILLSIHQINDQEFWTGEFQKDKTIEEINLQYYETLYTCINQYKDYSVLAHLDLITRYLKEPIDFKIIKPILTKILKQVIKDNKGIEVNTSFHRYGLKDCMPSTEILKLYQSLGGKIITIGSDSHKEEHLGAFIKEILEYLKRLGFDTIYTFDYMKAIPHHI